MRGRFDFGDFKITKRDVLASISIVTVLLLIGVLISSKISEHQMDKNEEYNKAIKISSQDLFVYGMDTNIGNAFVYGDLETVDTVTYPELDGEYMTVKKVKERYTKHERTVIKTREVNGKEETYMETEEYWTWDEIDRWTEKCKNVTFLGVEFNYGDIYTPREYYITTQKESRSIRYVYYGSSTKYTGTLFAYLGDGTITNQSFYNSMTIDKTVDYLESGLGTVTFWIIWIAIIAACVYGVLLSL